MKEYKILVGEFAEEGRYPCSLYMLPTLYQGVGYREGLNMCRPGSFPSVKEQQHIFITYPNILPPKWFWSSDTEVRMAKNGKLYLVGFATHFGSGDVKEFGFSQCLDAVAVERKIPESTL